MILNFSSYSSKDIFQTSLSVHFSSPWGSNLRVFYYSMLMKWLEVSEKSFSLLFTLALSYLDLCEKESLLMRKNLLRDSIIIIQLERKEWYISQILISSYLCHIYFFLGWSSVTPWKTEYNNKPHTHTDTHACPVVIRVGRPSLFPCLNLGSFENSLPDTDPA